MTKLFSPRELAARVRSVLRRPPDRGPSKRLDFGDVVLERETREARRASASCTLTTKEFDLLWFLAQPSRRVFSREQLMASVWGYTAALDWGTVTVHVRRLRERSRTIPRCREHPDGLGRRLPAGSMISTAPSSPCSTLAVGLALAYALRLLPTVAPARRARVPRRPAPARRGAASGWVMFHMGDDVKILAVTAASALTAIVAALVVARSIANSVDRVATHRGVAARRSRGTRAGGRARRAGRARGSFNEMGENLQRLFDSRASSSHGRATTSAPRSRTCRRCSRRSRTASASPDTCPRCASRCGCCPNCGRPVRAARIDADALTLELQRLPIAPVVSSSLRGVEAEARLRTSGSRPRWTRP